MWEVWAVTFDSKDVATLLNEETLCLIDTEFRKRLERFFKREDSFRGLIGRLLPHVLLKRHDIPPSSMLFATTTDGKPYIATEELQEPIGYNITHDNGLIAMVFSHGEDLFPDPPAYRLGIDVMKLQLPRAHTFSDFVEIFEDQLTPLERDQLSTSPPLPRDEGLRRFFLIWTLKEAYTKALGLGLGFDFKRIEYDVVRDVVRIDGVVPRGWEFVRFGVHSMEDGQQCSYVGVVARYLGKQFGPAGECAVEVRSSAEWLKVSDAATFMEKAIRELS